MSAVAKLCPHRLPPGVYCARCAEPDTPLVLAPKTEIAVRERDELLPGATETGLSLPDHLSQDDWRAIGDKLGRAHRASQWWVGDWINFGAKRWGEKYTEAQEITGLSLQYLRVCAMVASRFSLLDRSNKLTWTHHLRAKALANAEEWLDRAEREDWSVRELQERTASAAPSRTQVMPGKRHVAFVAAAGDLVRIGGRWEREMTDALAPPEARKQLTVLRNAAAVLAEVIEAVEYRADTPHTFLGR